MSFLNSLKSSASPTFDKQRALMTIAMSAVAADGSISDSEARRIRAMCSLSPIFADNSSEQDKSVIDFALNVLQQMGNEAINRAAQALTPELRETAFAFACDVILGDGIVGDDESEYLSSLAGTLGITEDVGDTIVQSTLIRNRNA